MSALRFGRGDLYNPQKTDAPVVEAQRVFWEEIHRVSPEVIEDLRDRVFPVYRENYAGRSMSLLWDGSLKSWEARDEPERELLEWAERYHLLLPGILELALFKISQWRAGSPVDALWAEYIVEDPSPAPQIRGWDPEFMTWPEYEARALGELRDYGRMRVEQLRKAGYLPVPKKHGVLPDASVDPDKTVTKKGESPHFEWLVRFQVQDWSRKKIAHAYHVDYQTVAEAIKKTAVLMGLHLRDTAQSDDLGNKIPHPKSQVD